MNANELLAYNQGYNAGLKAGIDLNTEPMLRQQQAEIAELKVMLGHYEDVYEGVVTHPVKEQDQTCHTDGGKCGVGGYCRFCKFSIESQALDWGDRDDEWTDEIKAAHPLNTGFYDTYHLACEMVHNRHGKFALVALVNWLIRKAQEK